MQLAVWALDTRPDGQERKPYMSNQSEILASTQQYHRELSLLPRLTQDDECELRDRARAGDELARSSLIENCLRYVTCIAACYKRYVHHDDYLDLVGV